MGLAMFRLRLIHEIDSQHMQSVSSREAGTYWFALKIGEGF